MSFETAYKVAGYEGVAWRVLGYDKHEVEEHWEYDGEGDPDDEDSYIYYEPEEIEDRSRVRAHMVGDDQIFTFDVEDLTQISEDDYCPECGQIGCKAYG